MRALLTLLFLILLVGTGHAQLRYTLGWGDNPSQHLFDLTFTVADAPAGGLTVALPAWRPGRYSIQNYAANVQELSAVDGAGQAIAVRKLDKTTWRVATTASGAVTVRYRYSAATLDAGNSYLSADEAYFNGSNLFLYVPGREAEPVELTVQVPTGWTVATALTGANGGYTAPSYDHLIDCPTIISPTIQHETFTQGGTTYHLWVQDVTGTGPIRDWSKMKRDWSKMVAAQAEIMGGRVPVPEFHFLYHLIPTPMSHGVEHRTSTSIVRGPADLTSPTFSDGFLGLSSHEFFHLWNIKRFRPAGLGPFDLSREAYTPLLYVAEGFTSYYADLSLVRAGVWTAESQLVRYAGDLNGLEASPGRKVTTLAESSWDAWLSGYGAGNTNTRVDFYGKGKLAGLLFDLAIREASAGKRSLDDVMRALETRFGTSAVGYTEAEFEALVSEVAGRDMSPLIRSTVHSTADLSFAAPLRTVGLEAVQLPDTARAAATLNVTFTGAGAAEPTVRQVLPDGPGAKAGLDVGDVLLSVNGQKVRADSLTTLMRGLRPGQTVELTVRRWTRSRTLTATLAGGGDLRWTVRPLSNPTAAQRRAFAAWLGQPLPSRTSN